jgi:diguanylate cyclase (GGDEF)-like protein
MLNLLLRDIVGKDHITVDSGTPLEELSPLLQDDTNRLLVVLDHEKPVGVITGRGLIGMASDGAATGGTALDFANESFVTVSGDKTAGLAVEIMIEKVAEAVIVTDEDGRFSGVLTRHDMLELLHREMKAECGTLNIIPEMLLEAADSGSGYVINNANEIAVSRLGTGILGAMLNDIFSDAQVGRIMDAVNSRGRIENIRIKKDDRVYEISGLVFEQNGTASPARMQLVIRDVTDELLLSSTDALTGLYNKRFINEFLVKEIERSRRLNKQFSIVISDLDDFRTINDSFGYLAGNAVLQAFAGMLSSTVRNLDVAGRYGGDEFVVILPEASSETAYSIMERLRGRMEGEMIEVSNDKKFTITASFGIATYPADGLSSDCLIIAADERLNTAKRLGKNKIACT